MAAKLKFVTFNGNGLGDQKKLNKVLGLKKHKLNFKKHSKNTLTLFNITHIS